MEAKPRRHQTFTAFNVKETGHPLEIPRGIVITFEGGEGSGKTTHSIRLYDKLQTFGYKALLTREPGGTPLGEAVRATLTRYTKKRSNTPLAEAFMFAASRAQLCEKVIEPALKKEYIVILDRFIDSSIAYQGYGSGLSLETIRDINKIASRGITPDLTFLMETPPGDPLQRLRIEQGRMITGSDKKTSLDRSDKMSRFENESMDFHKRVAEGYRQMASQSERWYTVKVDENPDNAAEVIWQRVVSFMNELNKQDV